MNWEKLISFRNKVQGISSNISLSNCEEKWQWRSSFRIIVRRCSHKNCLLWYQFILAINSDCPFTIRDKSSRILVESSVIRTPEQYRNSIRLQSVSFACVVRFARCRVAALVHVHTHAYACMHAWRILETVTTPRVCTRTRNATDLRTHTPPSPYLSQ